MSRFIPQSVRTAVAERANHRCEYCLLPELAGSFPFEVDHIVAIKHGGPNTNDNLALSCPRCNRCKGTDLTTIIDKSDNPVRIYNPRKDYWEDHFEVENGGIFPKTEIGTATSKLLEFNTPERIIGRRLLAEAGLYP